MTAAGRSLATALWRARFASGLLQPSYTTSWDTAVDCFSGAGLGGASVAVALRRPVGLVGRGDAGEVSRTRGAGVSGARGRRSLDRRRHGVSEEGFAFGWRGATILRTAGQDRQLPDRGDALDRQSSCGSADRLSALSARKLGQRRRASR